jgi:hypothetical protein
MYTIIFRELFDDSPSVPELSGTSILFAAWTTDALFFHGRWAVMDNRAIAEDLVPFPSYLVIIDGKTVVERFDRASHRPATSNDVAALQYRTTVAPIRLQNALLAFHGFGEWDPEYRNLTTEAAWTRVRAT